MKPLFKLLLTTVLAFNLSACAATTAYWKTPLPENPNQYSAVERAALYNSFAIEEMSAFELYVNSVTLDGKKYGLETYYPTMLKVSPNLEADLNAIQQVAQIRDWTSAVVFTGSLTPTIWTALSIDTDIDTRKFYYLSSMAGILVSLGIYTGFLLWQQDKYNQIKSVFNEDLKFYLNGTKNADYSLKLNHGGRATPIPTQLTVSWMF